MCFQNVQNSCRYPDESVEVGPHHVLHSLYWLPVSSRIELGLSCFAVSVLCPWLFRFSFLDYLTWVSLGSPLSGVICSLSASSLLRCLWCSKCFSCTTSHLWIISLLDTCCVLDSQHHLLSLCNKSNQPVPGPNSCYLQTEKFQHSNRTEFNLSFWRCYTSLINWIFCGCSDSSSCLVFIQKQGKSLHYI